MKMHTYYISLVLIVLSFYSCGNGKNTSAEEMEKEDSSLLEVTQDQFNSIKMEISTLLEKEFHNTIKASGKIDVPPKNRAKVTSLISGYVKSTSLLVGDKVSKGQPLLTLESPEVIDLQQSYLEAASQMKYLKSEYERQKTLFEENIASQKKFFEAESAYKQSKGTYESLRQKLNLLRVNFNQVEQGNFSSQVTVFSPISGDITAVHISIGMAVSPTDVIVEIVETQAIHLELAVFEKDVLNLDVGQKIKFSIPQIGAQEFEAQVSQIGKSVGGNDRVINVYASLENETKKNLLTGMFVEAQLITGTRKAFSVPFDAITTEEGNHFLLVFESEKEGVYTFRKTLVEIGERNDDWIEVIPCENCNTETRILIKGVYDVI